MPVEGGIGPAPPAAPRPGSCHENPRSCAGAAVEGLYGSFCRGGGSLPDPSPGDIPTVRCMGWCRRKSILGVASPGRPSPCLCPCWGYRDYCPRPWGRGRSAGGAGGVGEIGEQCMECRRIVSKVAPPAAPFPGSFHENPRSCAGTLWEGRYGSLFRGRGSLPGPSPGDITPVRCMR